MGENPNRPGKKLCAKERAKTGKPLLDKAFRSNVVKL
jgi:hypothetical protein